MMIDRKNEATFTYTMRVLSKEDLKLSRENMRGAASLWKERQTLSLPPTCTQLVLCEKGKFALDGEFSKNAPYKQKIIPPRLRIRTVKDNSHNL